MDAIIAIDTICDQGEGFAHTKFDAPFVLFDAPGQEGKPFAQPDTPDERLLFQPC